jgi:hypothetical protein
VRSGLETLFGEPTGERHGEGSELWSVTGGEGAGDGGEPVSRDGESVGPVLPCDERVVSSFGVFGGWVVVVDLSPPGPEVPDVADEIAAFAVELSAPLQDGASLLLGDVFEVVLGGGDVAFSGGPFAPGVAAFTPAAVVDGSFELTAMLLGVVECASGGVDGVVVGLAGGFEFVEQHAEFVDALIDAFLLGRVRHGAARARRGTRRVRLGRSRRTRAGSDSAAGRPVPAVWVWWAARSRRTLVAGRSARSLAKTCSRTSTASAMSWLSVTTNTRFSTCPRVIATYNPRQVGRRRRQGRGTGGSVGLVAGLGGGVAELHMFSDVAGGKGDGAVPVDAGHGQGPVGTDGVDGPVVAVADALSCRCSQESFVASCRDYITDRDLGAVAEFEAVVAELTKRPAVVVDGVVDGIDVVVGGGRDRHVLAPVAGAGPVLREVADMLDERCRKDTVMVQVGVEPSWVAVSQLQRRGFDVLQAICDVAPEIAGTVRWAHTLHAVGVDGRPGRCRQDHDARRRRR